MELGLNTAGVKAPTPIFATTFSINRTAQRTYLRQNAQNNNKQHFTGTQYVLLSIKCSQIGAVIHHHPTCYISDILYNTSLPSCPSQDILNQPHNCHVTEKITNPNINLTEKKIKADENIQSCRKKNELIYSNRMKMLLQTFCCQP